MHSRFSILVVIAAAALSTAATAADLTLQPEDRIVFVGNTFAERMREYNYFETLVRCRFPELNLTFRNMGWSADEITLRPRPLNFGDIHQHLTDQQADVIFLCYGFNESFAGEGAVDQFKTDYAAFVEELRARQYNGESAPRLVIVSPTPQESIDAMPEVYERNSAIGKYTDALRSLAEEAGLPFIDLFNGLHAWRDRAGGAPLTFNGIHFEEQGYWAVALVMIGQLGWSWPSQQITLDATQQSDAPPPVQPALALTDTGYQFTLEHLVLPGPTPPEGAAPGSASLLSPPVLQITGLPAGEYGLYLGDTRIAAANDVALAQGIPLRDEAAQATADAALAKARQKNRLFFDRWRAVNGYYIYGDRKEPFGVQSFPPEMQRFDELVREEEAAINSTLNQFTARTFELRREEPAS